MFFDLFLLQDFHHGVDAFASRHDIKKTGLARARSDDRAVDHAVLSDTRSQLHDRLFVEICGLLHI
jgi:hypothetical protein